MKEFNCIMSGQLDNSSSSVYSYLSDDNDEPDLQQTLSENNPCRSKIHLSENIPCTQKSNICRKIDGR